MVNVWFAREGDSPTTGGPSYRLALGDAATCLELEPRHFWCGPESTPRFPASTASRFAGRRHVVLEVKPEEVERQSAWKPGYYRSPLSVEVAAARLGEIAVRLNELDPHNW